MIIIKIGIYVCIDYERCASVVEANWHNGRGLIDKGADKVNRKLCGGRWFYKFAVGAVAKCLAMISINKAMLLVCLSK